MGGGLMQLVAYGAQDVYLTGNPQITLFKVVYRRHTNFSVECIELSVETAKPGGRPNVQILRNGDLATKTFLRVKLPELVPSNQGTSFNGLVAWVRRLGHALIRSVEIDIGGAPIDKHFGVWLDVWYELTHSVNQERGYAAMIGDVDQLTSLQPSVAGGYDLFIPLQFWFCRNYGLALPLIALQYHDVRLIFEFEDLEKLYVYTRGTLSSSPSFQSLSYVSAGVLIDYVYLDSEERRRFAQVGHEYLIEQLQTDGEQQLTSQTASTAPQPQSFTLNFNHPCKEIIWLHKLGAFNGSGKQDGGWFLTYSNTTEQTPSAWAGAVEYAANSLANGSISVAASNPWAATPGAVVQSVTFNPASDPITTAVIPQTGTTWKFVCTNTTSILAADVQTVWILTNPVTQGQVNLATGLSDVTVELNYQDLAFATPVTNVVVTDNTLSLVNLSVPLVPGASTFFADLRLQPSASRARDVHVVQPNNYSVTLDGRGNIVLDGLLVLNGHDRFSRREGNYFNFVQPWEYHTHTPADGINMYSFALHPEQHQPTGSCNMSRIDNTKLNYRTQDPLRQNPSVYAPLNYALGTAVWIFATNYNVLRIMSGMGGLAYSN